MTRNGKIALVIGVLIAIAAGLWLSELMVGGDGGPGAVSSSGKAQVGGPFTLVNDAGETVTDETFRGRYMLIYFGFTFCPDVCPTTLAEVLGWQEELKTKPDQLRFIMVTVDPERDTPDNLRQYLDAFSTDFIGLVGDETQTEAAKKAFGVYSQKVKTDEATDYLVDHTASVFVLDKDGRFQSTIAYGEDKESAIAKIRRVL